MNDARKALIAAVAPVLSRHLAEIRPDEEACRREYASPEFLWKAFVLSPSTMGGVRGAQLAKDPEQYAAVSWDALSELSPDERRARLETSCRRAKVRMPAIKADWLDKNYEKLTAFGGPAAARDHLENLSGANAKMKFLQTFTGVGPKYARNIFMDVYHPEFRNKIAIDVRLDHVLGACGLAISGYEEKERFFLEVAEGLGVDGWHLDRLLFGYTQQVIERLAPAA